MTIKKLILIAAIALAAPIYAGIPQQKASFGNRINTRLKEMVGKVIWQYNLCKIYDRNVNGTTARMYRSVLAGRFALGAGLIGGISYGGYSFIKHLKQTKQSRKL